MRNYTRKLDGKELKALAAELGIRYPEQYKSVMKQLMDVSREAAYRTGGQSFGLEDLRTTTATKAARYRLKRVIADAMALSDPAKRSEKILSAAAREHVRLTKEVLEETIKSGNPLGQQVLSGARGGAATLKRLIGGDMLYVDHHEEPIPIPVQRTYAEGLSPAEWWAATYGARKGLTDVKLSTGEAGWLGKQLAQLAHRLIVTDLDADEDPQNVVGLPVDLNDPDNVGALLASPAGEYPRNTELTPRILKELANQGKKRILVRSPTVGGPSGGGVYARDAGIREGGVMPSKGSMLGLIAAQSIGERLTQTSLSSKHSGGVVGETPRGLDFLDQLMQVPKQFKGGALHAQLEGKVRSISQTPTGGYKVMIDGEEHISAPGQELSVKEGDLVEAGDVISSGIPNPSEIVKHKGIGEGRRYWLYQYLQAARDSGMDASRRNVELLSRGLIDHVELQDELGEWSPGDVVQYRQIEKEWTPRDGTRTLKPQNAVGKYLEAPVLHHTIGTRIQPSMLADFSEFGVSSIEAHDEPPPFVPRMIRAAANIGYDPDWLTRLVGAGQKKSLLSATVMGDKSDIAGTSYVPARVVGTAMSTVWPASTSSTNKQW